MCLLEVVSEKIALTNIQFKFAILVNSIDVQRRHLRRQDSKYVKMAFKNLIKKLKKVAESGMLP